MSLLHTLRSERIPRRPAIALVVAVVTVALGERWFATVVERALDTRSGFPPWLPEFGSIGETVLAYTLLFDVVTYAVVPLLLVWFGYELGRAPSTDGPAPWS